ncbi:uncharacterized protein LOC121524681 [Cheilinus undulatus]|uniref:uncharacterized protein LOC121524681 n=1 Tax=Cheilinus undulatus TaxID=241271 RepID=UPI001BD4F7E5|nr:uncharacterized protein LOC121524681 [Cheilinus undulatus]
MSDHKLLSEILGDLGKEEFNKFKYFLRHSGELKPVIPWSELEHADRLGTVNKIIGTYSHQSSDVVEKILRIINHNDLAEKLQSSRSSMGAQDQEQLDHSIKSSVVVPSSPPVVVSQSHPLAVSLSPPVVTGSIDDQNPDTSHKYDKIVCKDLIQSGPPAIYQLTPKKDKIGSIRRLTLGKRDPNKSNRTLLLIGETGTGKSTMINALVNYDLGVEWEDNVCFKIVEEEKTQRKSDGLKSDVIVYKIFGFEDKSLPYSLTVIDTPGYGDTRGIEHDEIIRRRLLDLFHQKDEIKELHAVGLVLKASENRLSDRLRYVFDSVVSLFGNNMEKNIVIFITHSYGRMPENVLNAIEAADIKCAQNEKNRPVHFLFENCQHKEKTKETKVEWDITKTGIRKLADFLSQAEPQNLKMTSEVLNARIGLTTCIQDLQDRTKMTDQKKREIEEDLRKAERVMKSNEKFTVEVEEEYTEEEDVSGGMWALVFFDGALCCTVCKQTCHHPCTLAWYPSGCDVMKDGFCTKCSGKCPVSSHVKGKKKYVPKKRKVPKTLEDMKQKFDEAKAAHGRLSEDRRKLMEEFQEDEGRWLDQSYQHVLKLEEIALNKDSLSTHVHLDFLIEKMKERDAEKVRRLEEIKGRENEGTRAGLRYQRAAGKADRAETKS